MKFSEGQFHLEKAQVVSKIFSGLHLPFTILGGLIDFMHLDVDVVQSRHKQSTNKERGAHAGHRLLIVIENVILVIGPGHHQEGDAPAWDFEAVMKAKQKLIDLINKSIERTMFIWLKKKKGGDGDPKDPGDPEDPKPKKAGKGRSSNWVKEKINSVLDEVLAHGMHASIRNIEIRYEDPRAELSGGPKVVAGFEIGSVQFRAQGVGDEELQDEEDFRVKGKWRSGTANNMHHDDSVTKVKSSLSKQASGTNMGQLN